MSVELMEGARPMKLSCLPVSFFGALTTGEMNFPELAKLASSLGIIAVDLGVRIFRGKEVKLFREVRGQIEDEGIKVAGIMAYPDFVNPDAQTREEEMSLFEQDLVLARELGAEYIRVTAGKSNTEITREQGIEMAAEGVLRAVEMAKGYGIDVLFEHHGKPSVWNCPDFNLPIDIFLDIFEKIKHAELGILFDTANPMVYGADPMPFLEQVYDRVRCVHISDIKTKGEQEMTVIGTGIVPIKDVLSYLKHRGYSGWISLEEVSHTGYAGVEKAVETVNSIWENC